MKEHAITTVRNLLEADNRLRELERQWVETGSLEDEYNYHQTHLRIKGHIELTKLSTEFTRWKEARKWFKKIYFGGKWATTMHLKGTPMRQGVDNITKALRSRLNEVRGQLFIAALGWRTYQVPGFNLYFTYQRDPEAPIQEMCASLWARGSNIDWQSVNQNCAFEGSYGLLGSQSSLHQDTIMLSAPVGGKAIWDHHIRMGK